MKKRINKILFITFIIVIMFTASTTNVNAKSNNYHYLSDLEYESKQVGWNNPKAFLINENESGNLLSLMVNGEKTYFLNGILAHATSKVVYDISSYETFDTFSAFIGVDTSRDSLGDGVKFSIYATNDYNDKNKSNWELLYQSKVLKGNTDSEEVNVKINGYKYLILYAHQNGNNASDHAVYADPIIYDSKNYTKEDAKDIDFIKSVDEYNNELKDYTDEEILKEDNLKLKLLQRTLVKKVGYSLIKAFASGSVENKEFLEWLFTNEDILEEYLLGGEPEGGSYYKALDVFSKLYNKHKKDIDNDVYRKTMMAISLAYATDVNFWQTAEKPITPVRTPSNALDRYEVIKKLYSEGYEYEGIKTDFNKDLYKKLQVEEMRWVVNNRISDIEIPWLNWYTQKTKAGKTDYSKGGYMDPYSYIAYNSGWYYEDLEYYKEESNYCAIGGNINKRSSGYERGQNCNDKYGLKHFGIETKEGSPLRLWTIWEEDGVCGSLAGTGSNIEMAYGKPSTLVSQPGHAAYFVSKRIENEDGTHQTQWQIGNAAAGWDKSYKGERMLLGWGNRDTSWVNTYNGSYLIVSQRAVDNFKDYKKAFMYNLVADIKTTNEEKEQIYNKALKVQPYNITSWYNLINTYLEDESKTSSDYYKLSKRIISDLEEFPLPMNDLLNLFKEKITDETVMFNNNLSEVLKSLTTEEKTKKYPQKEAIKEVANYLLGINKDLEVATFSFDGEDANKLMLNGTYKENNVPFEYTLNYEYDAKDKKVSSSTKWYQVTDKSTEVDLKDKLKEISKEHDIVIHILKDENRDDPNNLYFIDITQSKEPTNLYANSLESRVFGATDTMEWKKENDKKWTKFSEEEPNIDSDKITSIFVRNANSKTSLASAPVELIFEEAKTDNTKAYIKASRLTATASSQQNTTSEAAARAIDGNKYTYWHNRWDSKDDKRYIELEIDTPASISMIDYVPRQDSGVNGIITKAKIEVSMDKENWQIVDDNIKWKNDKSTKTYELNEPVKAKYIRITALESIGGFASAAMINLYEDRTKLVKNIDSSDISYQKEGYIYNESAQKPKVTITDDGKTLEEKVDYNIKYKNNVKSGNATIQITGIGNYEGTVEKAFTIAKAEQPTVIPEKNMVVTKDTLEEVKIPQGWSWSEPKTKLTSSKPVKVEAVYDNQEDYNNYKVEVLVEKKEKSTKKSTTTDVPIEESTNKKANTKEDVVKVANKTKETTTRKKTNNEKNKESKKEEKKKTPSTEENKKSKIINKVKNNKWGKIILTSSLVILACILIIKSTELIRKL